ncbi:MAG TPA: hypothetical protein VH988_11240 [Thermoanaerobaculia bacterium]|jgi:hypothetical protein|nr:hypothetical protein [Thermoanaerobaculia bacterium]
MPPQVFLSYSHDSPEHKDRVLALCNRLRRDGIDAWLGPAPSHNEVASNAGASPAT